MMQTGIFTGYFPYGLEETAKKIQAPRLQHGAAGPAFQGHRPWPGPDHQGTRPRQVRDTFRDHNLPICCVSGYTNIIHPDLAQRKADVGPPEGDHPQRARISARPT